MKEEFCTILFLPLLSGTEALPASAFYYIIGLKNVLTDSTGFLFFFLFFLFYFFFYFFPPKSICISGLCNILCLIILQYDYVLGEKGLPSVCFKPHHLISFGDSQFLDSEIFIKSLFPVHLLFTILEGFS